MHLTDEQLNEYLDHETDERAQIESHLSTCEDCSARLAALQELFTEIESLPELAVSPAFTVRLEPAARLFARLPRSLGLTLVVQIALAVFTLVIAAPFVMRFLAPYIARLSTPSLADVFLQLQGQWTAGLDLLVNVSLPAFPEVPVIDVSSLFIIFTLMFVSVICLF
jgi:hypothetical protein